jgi:hypothetical protein
MNRDAFLAIMNDALASIRPSTRQGSVLTNA